MKDEKMLEKLLRGLRYSTFALGAYALGMGGCGGCGDTPFAGDSMRVDAGREDAQAEAYCSDADGDSFYNIPGCGTEVDCNDNNDSVFPGRIEVCDYIDNNCNGNIDEGAGRTVYFDADKDGFGDKNTTVIACLALEKDPKGRLEGYVYNPDDCDDSNSEIHPDALELCDGIDNNCSGIIDDGGNSLCNDGIYCNGANVCAGYSGCLEGTVIDCSINNIEEISTCDYTPDGISRTLDSRSAFTSTCEESIGAYRCTGGDFMIEHYCDITLCEAECETDEDCSPTNCDVLDGCYERTFRDYQTIDNICLPNCMCTSNSCTDYVELITDEDGDGYDVECDNDCDDDNPNIHPDAIEIIDSVDNNCDGIIDPSMWLQVSAGLYHTCGIRLDGTVACWGYNNYGQSDAPEGETFIQVSAGDYYSCGLRLDNTVTCWGLNSDLYTPLPEESLVQISAGSGATCGLREDGSMACWGTALSQPEGTFIEVSVGGRLAYCVLRTDNEVRCRGIGLPVPSGTYTQVSVGGLEPNSSHACAIRTDNSVVCWGRNGEGQANPPEDSFIQVSAGAYHTCGLKEDNTVACWGYWSGGGVAPPETFREIDAGGNHNCGLREDNTLFCWGRNLEGQLDPPDD